MEKYRIHKLKKGDTVNSVAIDLGITPEEVRGWHNACCNVQNTIGYDFPDDLTEIFVYAHIREIKKENYPTAKFSIYTLSFKPNTKKVNYGVMYTIKDGDDDSNTIKYEISLEFKERNQEGNFVYVINKLTPTFINNEEATLLVDEVSQKINNTFYPLAIITNQENKYIGIQNYKEIKTRWEKVKENLYDDYQNDWIEQYIQSNEQTLKSESNLIQSLANDWFIHSFFSGIHTNYTRVFKFENNITFPVLPHIKPLIYKVEQKIDEYLDEHRQVIIDQEGQLFDQRTTADLINKQNFPEYSDLDSDTDKSVGTFRSKYFLNAENNNIESMYIECSVNLDKTKSIEIVASLID